MSIYFPTILGGLVHNYIYTPFAYIANSVPIATWCLFLQKTASYPRTDKHRCVYNLSI